MGFIPGCKDASIFTNQSMWHINKINDKKHMIILIDAESTSDKVWHTFMIKILNKVGWEGTNLSIIKALCENPQLTSY